MKSYLEFLKEGSATTRADYKTDKNGKKYPAGKVVFKNGEDDTNTKEVKEGVEQIDEISKKTLDSYIHKSFDAGNQAHKDIKNAQTPEEKKKAQDTLSKRNQGVIKAAKKLRESEEVEELIERVNVDHILQSLADKDINAAHKSGTIHVHKSDLVKAKAHLHKLGHKDIPVKSGLNEDTEPEVNQDEPLVEITEDMGIIIDLSEESLSYSEFNAKISAHRNAGNSVIDHKHSGSKSTYTVIDKYGHGRKYEHSSSGRKVTSLGKIKNVDSEPGAKGRPVGSKSGAR